MDGVAMHGEGGARRLAERLARLADPLPSTLTDPVTPGGFLLGGRAVGIKASGRPDLAVVAATRPPAAAAAVFTTNAVSAAPVRLSRRHLARSMTGSDGRYGRADAVLSTSGCANAATGPAGDEDQARLARALAAALGTTPERTLALSTGLIGTRLPVELIEREVAPLVREALDPSSAGLLAAADALLTTDTRRKLATVRVELPDPHGDPAPVMVTGLAKGVGMLHPRMATMLAIVMTDADVDPPILHALLARATARTWNQLSVDGDTSTNDTVFLLASGFSRTARVRRTAGPAQDLGLAVEAVARSLARQQAADGEGATTLVACQVSGGGDDAEARAVARAVVSSSLVKAAVHGRDPNWGRIVAAAGNASLPAERVLAAAGVPHDEAVARAGKSVSIDVDRVAVSIAGTPVFDGAPLAFSAEAVSAAMDARELLIRLDLGAGAGTGEAFGCDLTERYVVENSAYST